MNSRLLASLCVAASAIAVLALPGAVAVASASGDQNIAVPAYFYPPSPYWDMIDDAAPTASLAIANPDSGPGSAEDPNYLTVVQDAQDAGVTIVGYVNTANGNTLIPLATVERQVDEYYQWYGVNGIFFDDARCATANEGYYRTLKNYVRSYGGSEKIVLNPGTAVSDPAYGGLCDVLVTFEGKYADYISTAANNYNRYLDESWYKNYGPHRFWHIIIDCVTDAKMQKAVRYSQQRRAGYVFVTNDTTPNPYDTLPPYFSDEVSVVAAY